MSYELKPWVWEEDKWNGGYSGLFTDTGEEVLVPECRNDGDTGVAWFGDNLSEDHRNMIAAAPELLKALKDLTYALDFLIFESSGVYGLHENGDNAPWGDLVKGGNLEDWLIELEDARAAIAKAEGKTPATKEVTT